MRIELTLPLPPSVNTYWRQFRGRTILSKAGRQFKLAVAEYVAENRIPKLGEQHLYFKMVIRPRDKRKIDLDNRIKAVLDALQDAGVYEDDWQVDHLEVIRDAPIKEGLCSITIETLPETPTNENVSPPRGQS